jgi:hypothetical protein
LPELGQIFRKNETKDTNVPLFVYIHFQHDYAVFTNKFVSKYHGPEYFYS